MNRKAVCRALLNRIEHNAIILRDDLDEKNILGYLIGYKDAIDMVKKILAEAEDE